MRAIQAVANGLKVREEEEPMDLFEIGRAHV